MRASTPRGVILATFGEASGFLFLFYMRFVAMRILIFHRGVSVCVIAMDSKNV